jgi:hypothetical protein
MDPQANLDLLLGLYVEFRDRIHERSTREHELEDTFYAYVATRLFVYSFNTYKSIAWLLPSHFYEQAAILLRTLWEAGANFEWISREPGLHAKKFLEYTAVEHRHRLQRCIINARINRDTPLLAQLEEELREVEDVLGEQLKAFKYKDKRGRSKWQSRFSGPSLEEIVKEIGGEWLKEYEVEYQLGTAYTHAAPGGVLFPMLDLADIAEVPTVEDIERSVVIGASSIRTMIRVYRHWLGVIGSDDSEYLDHLFDRVCEAVAQVPSRDVGTPVYLVNLS